jgi:DNA polymerase-3 subunit gamma/tau
MVYYRKYRPQTIDDLDNSTVREKLSVVLKNSSTHAFLFTGPKGLGKTSAARIVAKVVNCERAKSKEQRAKSQKEKALSTKPYALSKIEPCNTCEQCISITAGTNLDVLEIDAASNRGIDEIRDLKEKIRLAPVSAKMKIYIIDEVHMLTTEAFNALLKTLEEPPTHAMFILCTTEPHKIPATITSRCFHITFKPATEEELVRSFKRIVKGEKIDIDDEALSYIASLSDRGFRDGSKILEEVVSLADGKKITKELVENKYQVSSILYLVFSILEALNKKDTKRSLEVVSEVAGKGIDAKDFLSRVIEVLHEILLSQMDIPNTKYDIPNTNFTPEEIKILFELLSKAYQEMKYAVVPQLPLELAIIEYSQREEEIEPIEKNEKDSGVTVSSLRKQIGTIRKAEALYGSPKKEEISEKPTVKTSTVELMQSAPNGEITKEWLEHFWRQLISEVKNYNHTIAGVLRGCSIRSYDKKTLIIQTSYKFHKERLSKLETLEALEKASKLLTGKDVQVVVELKNS